MIGNRRKGLTLAAKDSLAGYLFIVPFLIGFLAFLMLPLVESLRMVFSSVENDPDQKGIYFVFTGLANLKRVFFVDPGFTRMLTEELGRMAISGIATLIFALFVALLLNQEFRGRGLVRAVFFLPVILSSGALVGLETSNALLQSMATLIKESNAASASVTAVMERILSSINIGSGLLDVVFQVIDQIYNIAIASGIQIIIFLSGLQTIPASMYEAASIEGCTKWESFWKITFPMIGSLLMVNVVYTVVDFMLRSDNTVMIKISETMTAELDYGFSTAMAWSYFSIVVVILGVVSLIFARRIYYYE